MIRNHAYCSQLHVSPFLGAYASIDGAEMRTSWHDEYLVCQLYYLQVPMHLVVSLAHAERVRTARLHGHISVIMDLGIRCPRDRSCFYPPCTFHSPTASHAFLQHISRSYFGHWIRPCRCLFAYTLLCIRLLIRRKLISYTRHISNQEDVYPYTVCLTRQAYLITSNCYHTTSPVEDQNNTTAATRPSSCVCESLRSTQSAAASTTSTESMPVLHMANTEYQIRSSKSATHVQHI